MVESGDTGETPEPTLGRHWPHDPKPDLETWYHWVEYAKRRDDERRREVRDFTARMFTRV